VPVVGTALVLVAFLGALLAVLVITLDRAATRATKQQAVTQLASAARVGASVLAVQRADLRARAGQIVGSADLQRAVLAADVTTLERIAKTRRVQLQFGQHTFGVLPAPPRLVSTASIEKDGTVLARATVGLALREQTLARVGQATPLPPSGSLLLVRRGRVITGESVGARTVVRDGSFRLGSARFAAATAHLPGTDISVIAVEPLSEVTTSSRAYGRRTIFAAILTLLVVVALAIRFARPVARTFGELSDKAERDPLTGLANRRLLDARLEEEMDRARRHGTHVALVLVDVDDFKQFNDRYGHQCGDEILRTFGALLAGSVRELDLAARFGGEEFALVLPGTPVAGACVVAQQIREALAHLAVTGPAGEALRVTASFGAAAFPSCTTVEQLVEVADRSVYEAKHLGKNRVVGAGATPSVPAESSRRRAVGRRSQPSAVGPSGEDAASAPRPTRT
jgi:diguanylate cyclase (GGDEF)-like protein